MGVLQSLSDADHRLLLTMQQSESWFAQRSRDISSSADGHLYVVGGVLISLLSETGAFFFQSLLLAFTLERTLYWILKNSLRRRRPADALPGFESRIIASDEFSFPSGHSSAAFLFATALVLHFGAVALPACAWASAVAASRVYLGVHFPMDTVVGAIFGASIACVCWLQ